MVTSQSSGVRLERLSARAYTIPTDRSEADGTFTWDSTTLVIAEARLLGLPLANLLGCARDAVPVYRSGGCTSYSIGELQEQLSGWADQGIGMVKMKVGGDPVSDVTRVRAARNAIGPEVELFVDANGGYDRTDQRPARPRR